jgi:(p)ppGpp synthase/HD superfamily hydrolase
MVWRVRNDGHADLVVHGDSAPAQQIAPSLSLTTKSKIEERRKPRVFSEKFARALAYAERLHARQRRKATNKPYIAHLMSVTSIVVAYGGDEEMAVAALLHDAVEDQGGLPRLREIQRKFGARVARIVDGCTDSYTEPKPPWLERKRNYIARVAREPGDTRLVSAADKLSNARDILQDVRIDGDAAFDRFLGKKEGTLWYYRSLVTAFRNAGNGPLVDELDRVVTELERIAISR